MSYIQIEGGACLHGDVCVQGSKNAVLPILSAAVLHKGTTVLTHVPDISDVRDTVKLLRMLGCEIIWKEQCLTIRAGKVTGESLPRSLVGRMRSSFLLAGALLGRCGRVDTYYPGGCSIGARPVDLHLYGFERLGAMSRVDMDRIELWAEGLQGAEITLGYPSVGATENLLLAAVLAEGVTHIRGGAREPEVLALIECLNGMGACIRIQEQEIEIIGVRELRDSIYEIPGDRIVAGTLLAAVGSCGGEVRLEQVDPTHLQQVLWVLQQAGMELDTGKDWIHARCQRGLPQGMRLVTEPYPGFPTDLQAIFMAMLMVAGQESIIRETVFESRYRHVEQLQRLGGQIQLVGDEAWIQGRSRLQGNLVEAKDLRAGAALVVAGLAAEGITLISHAEYVERGYEDLPGVLCGLGATIAWIP